MLYEIALLLGYIAISLLCCSVFLIFFKKQKNNPIILALGYYLIWNLGIEIFSKIIRFYKVNNLPLLHIYTLGEFILLSFFYFKVFNIGIKHKPYVLGFVSLISILVIGNTAFVQNIFEFNSYAKTLVQIIILMYSIFYFIQFQERKGVDIVEVGALRLINSAILMYYAGSLFVFMFSNYFLSRGYKMHLGFWVFNALLNLFFQFTILFAVWKASKNKKSIS